MGRVELVSEVKLVAERDLFELLIQQGQGRVHGQQIVNC